eukprot:GHVU01224925.1.p1 GENE.GHVU01224925.1~~GHVU01224925.1.p1  ORF type:complete len:724 (+),score=77.36 GHVU01224925.1:298-2469(+)
MGNSCKGSSCCCAKTPATEEEGQESGKWSSNVAFVFAAIGSAVGLGNLWRFPNQVYSNGGAAFLIPYFLLLLTLGVPLLSLEIAIGQFFQGAAVKAMGKLHRRFWGLGLTSVLLQFVIVCYYNLLICWALIYLVNVGPNPLPWGTSDAEAAQCGTAIAKDTCNAFVACAWKEPTGLAPYCKADVLKKADAFYNDHCNIGKNATFSNFSPWILLAMLFTWAVIFFALVFGARVLGYLMYIMMTIPTIVIIILVIVGATLPGAGEGVKQFIGRVDWTAFQRGAIWSNAASQVMFTLSICGGVMIVYASYNPRNSNTVALNIWAITIADTIFSLLCGFAVFSIVGFVSHSSDTPIADLNLSGSKLAFTTFAVGLSRLGYPGGNILSFLFFATVWMLGVDTSISLVEANVGVWLEGRGFKTWKRVYVVLVYCGFGILWGVLYSFEAGSQMLDGLDWWANEITFIAVGFAQAVAHGWCFNLPTGYKVTGKVATWVHTGLYFFTMFLTFLVWHLTEAWIGAIVGGVGLLLTFLAPLGFFHNGFINTWKDKSSDPLLVTGEGEFAFTEKAYWLYMGCPESFITEVNQLTSMNCCCRLPPYIITFLNKYFVPFICAYFLSNTHKNLFVLWETEPDGMALDLWVKIFSITISWILCLVAIVGTIWPDVFLTFVTDVPDDFEDPFEPSKAEADVEAPNEEVKQALENQDTMPSSPQPEEPVKEQQGEEDPCEA